MENIRVLLVDDDERYLNALNAFLLTHAGIEVVRLAEDGLRAARDYAETRPDVVVMDAFMPGADGFDATRLILAEDPQARVLVLTGHSEPEIERRSREAGASGFVAKQNAPNELIETIWQLARGSQPSGGPND